MQNRNKRIGRLDDFDYWSRLAQRNPERFEIERREMLEQYIATMPQEQQTRLNQTQWKIDQVRSLAKNPIDALNRVSRLMWDELMTMNRHQNKLVEMFTSTSDGITTEKETTAQILPFIKQEKD